MYYPYFRGKQYELLSLRETSKLLSSSNIIPVIEPVREKLSALEKCLETLVKNEVEFILIINPKHGDFKNDNLKLVKLIEEKFESYDKLTWGYIINSDSNLVDITDFTTKYISNKKAFIHYDFPKGKELASNISESDNIVKHLFLEGSSSRLYQRNFRNSYSDRVIVGDGFTKRKNREHPEEEHFSDLHLSYDDIGYDGFGDFLVVGDDYSESGGPAYAVAIHITYLDDEDDLRIMHFVSDRTESPVDPAGKFLEALEKLKNEVENNSHIKRTTAIEAFLDFHKRGHFPGLGYVKKLAMNHHIELLATFLSENK
ncbi:hypothetical protein BIY24_14490 [Halobacteriovorax marinus]|uniref:sce7725 family protein n=1 Tax=Halobacteriovorax marinus TaxID=97084 RepID=UPI000BC32D93|nr:sce7725 family protein [Halobacteriovorax marinus]ATH09107.1 hypothetical protein BIY24_14490 [Halobacteriovorax marinus]